MTTPITTEPNSSTDRERRHRLEHYFAQNFDSLVYPLLADIYLAEGDLARARKVCTVGLEHHPGHAPGLFLLATMALREGNIRDAETLLLQTLSHDEYHLEAAELLVAVQERLRRKKSVLEQAYLRLLRANPLSRGAQFRLKRLQAERELVRGVKDELRAKRSAPAGSEMEEAQVDELQTLEPAEPIREMWTELGPEAAGPVEAPTAGEPIVELPEVDEAEQTWEANIKRLAAMIAASSGRQEEIKPGVTPLKPEAAAEVEAPSPDTAAPLFQEPGAGIEQQGESLDTLEAEEKIDEEPGELDFEPAVEETGPEGEVLDTLSLAGEGEVAGPFVTGIAAHDDETGPEVESPLAIIPEGEKPEEEPFKPEATPLRSEAAALEDEFADAAGLEDLAQQEKPFQLDVGSLLGEAEREGELIEAGPLEGLLPEDQDAGPIGEMPDSESLHEGEPEAVPGEGAAEKEQLAEELFEPGQVSDQEQVKPESDVTDMAASESREQQEEPYQPEVESLQRAAKRENELIEAAALAGEDTVEDRPGTPPLQKEGDEEDLYKIEDADKDTGIEPFEPGTEPDREEKVKLEDEGIDLTALKGGRRQEEPYRPDAASLQRETEREDELVEAAIFKDQDMEDKGAVHFDEIPDSESLHEGEPEAEPGERAAEREQLAEELFEPGQVSDLEQVKPGDEGDDTRSLEDREQEEPHRPDVESLRRAAKRENELIEAAALAGEDTVEDRPGAPPLQKEGDEEDLYKIEDADKDTGVEPFEPGTEPDREEEVKLEEEGVDLTALKGGRRQEEPYRSDAASLQRETEREDELVEAAIFKVQDMEDKGAAHFDEMPDRGSLIEGEPEAMGGDVEVPPAESRAEEQEAFEPGARHLKESGLPAEDIETAPVDGSAEEEELFEPDDITVSEEAPPVEEDLGADISEEQEAAEEQVWPGAAPTDKGITGPEAGLGEGAAERERPAEELFEPGLESDLEQVKPGDEGDDTRSLEDREQEEPHRPDVEFLQRAAKRENELIEAATLAGEDTVEDRPGAPPLQKEGDEEDLYKIEDADKDTGKKPFEPGTEPDREEEVKPEDESIDQTALKGKRRQEEPYRPDAASLQRETEREDELARAAILEGQDLEDESAVPFDEMPDSESLPEGEPEAVAGDVAITLEEGMTKAQKAFEPGAGHPEESAVLEEDLETVAAEDSAGGEELFEPGDMPDSEEVPPIEEDLGTGLADEQQAAKEEVWPGAAPADEGIAGPEAEPGEGTAEREQPAEELFEPGAEPTREEEIAPGEKDLDTAVTEGEDTGEEPAWPDVSPPREQTVPESAPFDEAAPEVEDLAEEQALPGEVTEGRQTALEDEAAGRVTLEDKDLERESFEPGDQPLDEGDEAELGEAALEEQAVEGEAREEEPYRPDVDSLQKEAEKELEIIDRAVHDGSEMAGDMFEPSSAPPKEEAPPVSSTEQDQQVVEEAEPEIEELDEGEYEFESEFQAAEETDSRDTLGIDPKLATFTLATIYKVQGLYHQALQVLDLLEAKGGDLERIQDERESILQLMTTGTSLEPE